MSPEEGQRLSEAAPQEIAQRVHAFQNNIAHYRSSAYNEAQTRIEFIDPLFEALGWDVSNRRGYADAYKDVLHEGSLRTLDGVKAPDYSFRVGGTRKFFVEAKKPHVQILKDRDPAYQLRRYAWSAQLPVSVLTNFDHLVIYDTTKKPDPDDSPKVGRLLVLTYDDYLTRWQELEGSLSLSSVLQGDFDRTFAPVRRRRGTTAVDVAFLSEIEQWREMLAANIARRNTLSQRDLNFAVQQTIDRIIFLRICEDRGLEPYGNLQLILDQKDMYQVLQTYYVAADAKYNSGLFHFRTEKGRAAPPDLVTPGIHIDDQIIRAIVGRLYFPQSPYEFSVLPADLLGQVYEQFLGKVITLTDANKVEIKLKPEVKRAGGVFYTPTYIVRYIVHQTLKPLVRGQAPADFRPVRGGKPKSHLRILDPACGSGTFLLEAYQYLLDWYLTAYTEEPDRWNRGRRPRIKVNPSGSWTLTGAERKAILLDHVFGVDIDEQAVEVTKLSLLLKVLEGETPEVLQQIFDIFHERALPDLDRNIRCGNSLIDNRIFDLMEVPAELEGRLNPIDYRDEFGFFDDSVRFDAVIGNPPYVYRNATEDDAKDYYARVFAVAQGNFELYKFFVERGFDLLGDGGRLGVIVSSSFLVQPSFQKLRELLLDTVRLEEIAPLGPNAFPTATVDTTILIGKRQPPKKSDKVSVVAPRRPVALPTTAAYSVRTQRFKEDNDDLVFDYRTSPSGADVLRKVFKFPNLESGYEFGVGINTGFIRNELVAETKLDKRFHPLVIGRGLPPWGPVGTQGFIMYDADFVKSRGARGRSLPAEHLLSEPKVLVTRTRNLSMARRVVAAYDPDANYNVNRLSNLVAREGHDALALVALLNSIFYNWLFLTRFYDYEIKPVYLRRSPLPPLGSDIRKLAKDRYEAATSEADDDSLRRGRTVQRLDRQLDAAVFAALGLTAAEQALVVEEHALWSAYSDEIGGDADDTDLADG